MILMALLSGSVLWLLHQRFPERFLRLFGVFFLVLLIYASNKLLYGIPLWFAEGNASPLSLLRWSLLGALFVYSLLMRKPSGFQMDILLGTLMALLLADMLISSVYAQDISYSLMRAVSFALLAVVLMCGLLFYLYWAAGCLAYIRFNYYLAWLVIAPFFLIYLIAPNSSLVTVLMGQYAGFFGNQNMFGVFSALITPYVLFHWKAAACTRYQKIADILLLALIFLGLWLSGSRNGLISTLLAVSTYFFVVNLQDRLKILVAAVCLFSVLVLFPDLKGSFTKFIRKSTAQAQVVNVQSQFLEEKRYSMWAGVWPLFWKQSLTGYGFASAHLLVFPFTNDEEAGRSVHNSYLELFGDLGLPGITLLLLIFYRLAAKAVTLSSQAAHLLERNINAVFIAVFVAGSANAFFESWMFSVGNLASLMYWGPVAGLVARCAWRPEKATGKKNLWAAGPSSTYAHNPIKA